MLKIPKLIKQKIPSPEQGFTMLEVLVGILTTVAFLAGTMQLMVINAVFKVKAERQAQGMFWIQDDKEQIKAIAANTTVSGVPSDAKVCQATTSAADKDKGYAQLLKYRLVGNRTGMINLFGTPTTTTVDSGIAAISLPPVRSQILKVSQDTYTLRRVPLVVGKDLLAVGFLVYLVPYGVSDSGVYGVRGSSKPSEAAYNTITYYKDVDGLATSTTKPTENSKLYVIVDSQGNPTNVYYVQGQTDVSLQLMAKSKDEVTPDASFQCIR